MTGKSADTHYPSPKRAYVVIAILWVVTLFSQLDRQLPALLVQPIKQAFKLSDTHFSFIQGYAFAFTYTLLGLPLGRLVDRVNRRNLIIAGLGFWSAMTVLSGLAQSFGHLALARVGVGIGEAVLAPAAYSIIADYVAPERRGRALAIYYVSLAVGAGASMVLGGLVMKLVPATGIDLPLFGNLQPWQATFVFAGLPGIPLMAVLLLIREPKRRETKGNSSGKFSEFTAYIIAHSATFSRLIIVTTLNSVVGYGMLAWAPAHFQRSYGIASAELGPRLGVVIAITGLCGSLFSGWLSDRWIKREIPAARFRITLVAFLITAIPAVIWPLMPSAGSGLALLGLTLFGLCVSQAAGPAAIQDIVPNNMRGQAIALYLLVAGLLGIGFGPTSVALVTDHVFHDEQALRWALVMVSAPAVLIALWASWSGQKHYAQSRLVREREISMPLVTPF
jgi:MFS family permease